MTKHLALLCTGFLLTSCGARNVPPQNLLSLEETNAIVLDALMDRDMDAVARFAHPAKGVQFSPYGYIDTQSSIVVPADKLPTLFLDTALYTWGTEAGSGRPIELSPAAYFDRYVTDHDYSAAPEVTRDRVFSRGTMINNITEAYPGASWFEFHFPGFDPQYTGMDWRTLRLAYENEAGHWYLVAVIHDEWTP